MDATPTLGDILSAALTGKLTLAPDQLAQRAEDQLYVNAQGISA